MRRVILMLFLLTAFPLFSQISINIKPVNTRYLLYAPVQIRVTLHNYSSMPVMFGRSEELRGSLEFVILRDDKTLIRKKANSEPVLAGIMLKPGESKSFPINLAMFYNLQKTGSFSATAVLKHPKFADTYQSNQIPFAIRSGDVYWQRKIGIPAAIGEHSGKHLTRDYKVIKFNNESSMYYYLLVEDKQKVYALRKMAYDVGPDMPPQLAIDGASRLHAMFSIDPKLSVYYIYNPSGKLEKREVYIRTATSPLLVVNPTDSSIIIDGGRIARKDVDYREIKDLPLLDEVKQEKNQGFGELPATPDTSF